MTRVIVTGATGVLGSQVAECLARNHAEVTGTYHASIGLGSMRSKAFFSMDLAQPEDIRIPDGHYDVLVHCAAVTTTKSTRTQVTTRVNVEGTSMLFERAAARGIRRIVFISSLSALERNPSAYARSKLRGESYLKELAQRYPVQGVIIRPGLIISSDPSGIFAKLCRQVARVPIFPYFGKSELCTISLDELCEVIVRLSLSPDYSPGVITVDVCADELLSLGDIARDVAFTLYSRRLPVLRVPSALPLIAAYVLNALMTESPISVDNVYGLIYAARPDLRTLHNLVDFTPTTFPANLKQATRGTHHDG